MVSKKSSASLLSGALYGGVIASTYVRAETQVYNQPGAHYFTAPLGVTVKVTVIGGGGSGDGGLTGAKPGSGGKGGAGNLPQNQGNNCSTFKSGGVGESGGLYGGSETPGNGGDSLGLCSNAGKGGKGGVGGIVNSSSQTGYPGSPGLKGGDGCVILEY